MARTYLTVALRRVATLLSSALVVVAAPLTSSRIHESRYDRFLARAASPVPPDSLKVTTSPETSKNANTVSVRDFGARGDGVSDDTKAIQSAIYKAPQGAIIKFPKGTYLVSELSIKNRTGLSFVGEGKTSVIKQMPGAPRIATFRSAKNIVISQLQFDANGITSYGGVMFYDSEQIRIEDNWYIDSAPKPLGRTDRFAFVFGKGGAVSRDVQIRGNNIEDLQLEVDHARGVVIDGNTVTRAVRSAGIGIFTVGDNAVAEDFQISNNKIVDPVGTGIVVVIDPATSRNCIFRRISVTGNEVIRKATSGYGIRIGTIDNSKATTGNVFEDIEIKNNKVVIEAGAPPAESMIFANSSPPAGITFKRVTVTGNEVVNNGSASDKWAIDLRRIQHSVVSENTVKGVVNGISLTGDLLGNEVHTNSVDASQTAFQVGASMGKNRGYGNRLLNAPRVKLRSYQLKASDVVHSPQ
jgi:hypothetical protein